MAPGYRQRCASQLFLQALLVVNFNCCAAAAL
jgi:hypothetical protein